MTTKRRNLTPMPPSRPGTHAMRRGDARKEVTERVTLRGGEGELRDGWALNASRGGLRAILEAGEGLGPVELGREYDVVVGDPEGAGRKGRIVWLQEEPDGVIVGVEFVGGSGTHRAAAATLGGEGADAAGESGTSPVQRDARVEETSATIEASERRDDD